MAPVREGVQESVEEDEEEEEEVVVGKEPRGLRGAGWGCK